MIGVMFIVFIVVIIINTRRDRSVKDYCNRKRGGYSMRNPTPLTKDTPRPKVKK